MSAALQLKKWVVIIKYSHGRFSKFVIRRRGVWAREFWVLVSLPTFPRCPDGWDKRVSERFQRREVSDRFLAKLWAACFERKHTHTPPHTHTDTHTHTESLECPLNNPTQQQHGRCSLSASAWAHTVHLSAFVYEHACSHVWNLHVECICTCVCVRVSDDSRLIKLLHSNELWLSVWQLLWQPLFTTSPPTHTHTQVHAPTRAKPTILKRHQSWQPHWCVVVVVVKSLGKLC